MPRLRRDWAHPCHICAGTARPHAGAAALTSRGFDEKDFEHVADLLHRGVQVCPVATHTRPCAHARSPARSHARSRARTGHKRHQSFGKPSLLRRSSRLRSKRRRASCSRTSLSPSRRTRCVRTHANLRCAETSGPSLHSRALLCCARGRYYLAASVTKRQHRPSRWRAFRVYGSSVRTSRLSRPRIRCADSKAMRTSHEGKKKELKMTANDGPPMVRLGLVPLVI